MKSDKLPSGATVFAHELNALRADARGGSLLLAHQQLGALALPTNPTNGQTISLVYNGTTVTLTGKTGALSNPGDFAIQATAAQTAAVIAAGLKNPTTTTSTFIGFTGATAADGVLIQYCGYSLPSGGTALTIFSLNTSTASPLTSFSASTTVTGGSWTAQTMQLYVEDGAYYVGNIRVLFTGGSTPTFTAPVSNPRIDLVTADSAGTIAIVTGTESATPSAPSYPANKAVLCEVYHVVGETAIYDNDNEQSGQGYISNDVRPILHNTYISSQSQIASGVAIFDPGSEVQGDILYYNGSAWVLLPPGTLGQFLQTQGTGANPQWKALGLQSYGSASFSAGGGSNNTLGKLTGSGVNFDALGEWSTANNQFTAQITGIYILKLDATNSLSGTPSYASSIALYKNGSAVKTQNFNLANSNDSMIVSTTLSLSAGDVITCYVAWGTTSISVSAEFTWVRIA